MAYSRRQLANVIRMALFAVLMAVTAPAISQILAAACADTSPHCHHAAASAGKAHHVMQQCGYCVLQADLPAVPPPAALALVLPAQPRFAPAAAIFHPQPVLRWLAPHSRAPPFA